MSNVSQPRTSEKDQKTVAWKFYESFQRIHSKGFDDLVGRVLTVLDAITTDAVQRKAIKDVVRDILYDFNEDCGFNIKIHTKYFADYLNEDIDIGRLPLWYDPTYNPLKK